MSTKTAFFTNYSDTKFIDKIKQNLDRCQRFHFSVSFIKKPGLRLLAPNIEAALARGASGEVITSTYQNFTDVDSLNFFYDLQCRYPERFSCHLDKECFLDFNGNRVGFHSKGYLFEFENSRELLVGSSNITIYALLKNVEWDVSVCDNKDDETYESAYSEFSYLWSKTLPLSKELIEEYKTRLYYSIERWDMDYDIANSSFKPNYMQRKALKELNRIRAMGAMRALAVASAGSGKTALAAFDALNYNPKRLLYIVQEGSILVKALETFQKVFGNDRSYGLYNAEFKDSDADFVFSTNITMANSLKLFEKHTWDYIVIDECHHATADTYREIINYFEPGFMLGITATPERMDGQDVFELFDHNVPYELRLRDAIINRLVVPFKYYGIRDELIEYGESSTKGHKFIEQFSDEDHCDFIYSMIEKYRLQGKKLKALAFCRDVSHARRMSQALGEYYHTQYLTGKNSVGERIRTYKDLQDDSADLEMLFTVDILNEGVDIPGVNMVLFLRPTDSQTIFIQQLGRGLRNYEGKQFVTVLDFIGNDYKRSVQIAFALGSLSKNFVVEKELVENLVKDDFKSLGLEPYGVEIHLDDLSKKEVLKYINAVNFNKKRYMLQDYNNFKKFIGETRYPSHVDYLNNDFAPDLMKFLQASLNGRKNCSYFGFLSAIGEDNLPSFDGQQEEFVKYVSDLLPIVRPHEYLIIKYLLNHAGECSIFGLEKYLESNVKEYNQATFEHAIHYMCEKGFFTNEGNTMRISGVTLDEDLTEYLDDLLEYGLGKYEIDYAESYDTNLFQLWKPYRKGQTQQLLLNNPRDIQVGAKIYDSVVYAYVTVIKGKTVDKRLDYDDGYIDPNTFQWETVADISEKELNKIINSKRIEIFVRKVEREDGIVLPFTYIGSGKMEYVGESSNSNGAHIFRIPMDNAAPEDIYFDFKLRRLHDQVQ